MANWKATIYLGGLHAEYRAGKLDAKALGRKVAPLVRQLLRQYKGYAHEELEQIATDFETDVKTVRDYDIILDRLYDFGDRDHRLWVDTFKEKP